MPYNEADTRSKLIDPAIHARGWTEDLIRREETAGGIIVVDGKAKRQIRGRVDYTLRVKAAGGPQPVAVALIEAKAENLPPTHGLEQGKAYAASKRLNVSFVFSSNGHLFVEYDRFTNLTSHPRPLSEFPTPADLRARYENGKGFSLDASGAKPLLTPYSGGEGSRRYYQDAAIRTALEKIAAGSKRVLLTLGTGTGKTRLAVNLLKRIADAGQLRRALFVCDREELRTQGIGAFQAAFGPDAAAVLAGNAQKNARILVATYQTLDVDTEDADANFLTKNYPPDYFSHLIIDECHRSAWGKWSQVLTLNPNAIQIGLTATPRTLETSEKTAEAISDAKITGDNLKHFGEPAYEYDMGQGIDDGYLAACEIIKRDIWHDDKATPESETVVAKHDLNGKKLRDANTGAPMAIDDAKDHYGTGRIEQSIQLPERVMAMAEDLFEQFTVGGASPEQKTIIFCASDSHADRVAVALNNLYVQWCAENGKYPADYFAFKCTAASGGGEFLPELRGSTRSHFIATTVELLSTGVDVPAIRNVVFFKYVKSPISFYQMVGRGTRLDPASGKLMFRVFDYTNATRLFGKEFKTKFASTRTKSIDGDGEGNDPAPTIPVIEIEGFDVRVTPAGHFILTMVDGTAMPVTVEEYRARLAEKLVLEAPTLEDFRASWISPPLRQELLSRLPDSGRAPMVLRALTQMEAFDLYDVLAEIGYGMAPRTRDERADAFGYKHADWLRGYPDKAASTIRAVTRQFARVGTDVLENPSIFRTPDVMQAGGLAALAVVGSPAEVLKETKLRMFAT